MEHFAGLDVSVKETSVCIVDDTSKIVREVKVASEPAALLAVLKNPAYHFKQIGLEAGTAVALVVQRARRSARMCRVSTQITGKPAPQRCVRLDLQPRKR